MSAGLLPSPLLLLSGSLSERWGVYHGNHGSQLAVLAAVSLGLCGRTDRPGGRAAVQWSPLYQTSSDTLTVKSGSRWETQTGAPEDHKRSWLQLMHHRHQSSNNELVSRNRTQQSQPIRGRLILPRQAESTHAYGKSHNFQTADQLCREECRKML